MILHEGILAIMAKMVNQLAIDRGFDDLSNAKSEM